MLPLLLAMAPAVRANPFWLRQESSSSASTEPTSATAEDSASATGAAPSADASSTSPTSSTASTTSSSSSAAAPSITATCHIADTTKPEEDIIPFCEPVEGQYVYVGETYPVSWDPALFTHNSTNMIELKHATEPNSTMIWSQSGVVNEVGQVNLFMHADYLLDGNKNNTNLTLFIHSVDAEDVPTTKSGPVFTLITNSTLLLTNHTSDGNSSKELGEKAGIPLGLGVFLIAVAGLVFWYFRRRRNNAAGYMGKRTANSSRMTGDESGTGGRGGFRDEPTRGMELQDRGHGRQDSWEAGWDSASSQGGGGNAFRDEIDRQRRR
ncbi:MAG: hypothetical protein Q9220_004774 [cf. Caloplaca sp. 1 TL-2023]